MFTRVLLFFFLLASAINSWSYGATGHRIIGELAQRHLTPSAHQQVLHILGNQSLAEASTWPDEMRSAPAPFWEKTAGQWHYANIHKNQHYYTSRKNPNGDIYLALTEFIHVLEGKPIINATIKNSLRKHFKDLDNPAIKTQLQAFALRFVIHLVGDIHQPLHLGYKSDRGGNDITVNWFGKKTNLHWVWDSGLIDQTQLSFTEFTHFLDRLSPDTIYEYQSSKPIDWVNEAVLLRETIYDVGGDNNLHYDYVYQYRPVVKVQLQKAGIRLAGLLNMVFDPK